MRKFFTALVIIMLFATSVFAGKPCNPFRLTCCDKYKDVIELYKDGSCVYIAIEGFRYEGTYTWEWECDSYYYDMTKVCGTIKIYFKDADITFRGEVDGVTPTGHVFDDAYIKLEGGKKFSKCKL